jgi:capsular exopolysaccharide synthesis family protein
MVENADKVIHFHEYFNVIRNRLWVIFTIFILTVASGAYVTEVVIPKTYTASSQIQILQERTPDVPSLTDSPDITINATEFEADFQKMQSQEVLQPIISDLKLDEAWARELKLKQDKLTPLEAYTYMKGNVLSFEPVRGTNIVNVTASSQVASEAAAIANAVAQRYKAMRDLELDAENNRGIESFTSQITQQQAVVDDKKAVVDKLRAEASAKNVQIAPDRSGLERDEEDLKTRKAELLDAKEQYDARVVLWNEVKNLPDDQFISTLVGIDQGEADIANLRDAAFKKESDIDHLLKDGFEVNHPQVQALQGELDRMRSQITELIAGKRRAMAADIDINASRITLLQNEVTALTDRLSEDQQAFLEPYNEAERDLEEQQSILNAFIVHRAEVQSGRQLLKSPVTIVALAEPPEHPSSPKVGLYMIVSVMAGLCIGVCVAFLIEYLDTSVKTMADAESLLGLPVLSIIPNKGGPMPMTQDSARLPHAEGYRILRAKLDLKVQNGVGPSLSVLSGGPGEGKSTTIYNLAVVCAQAGQSVILVDCDLRRPTLHELVNLPNDRGLANYLRGECEAIECIQQTALSKLHVLTSGDMAISEIGVLAGDKIRVMLEDLKQRYDLVLVDSPPVLGISDGSIIAREVDYVILVIQHRRYPREISLRAKRAIEEVHGNCVGMVLNSVSVKSDDSYYYYSNYGNYYKKADRGKKRKTALKAKTNGNHVSSARKPDLQSEEF